MIALNLFGFVKAPASSASVFCNHMAADLDVERPGGNCTRVTRRYDYNRMTPSKGIVVGIDGPALFIDQDR